MALTHSTAQIQQFRIQGPHAAIQASGTANFKNTNDALALKVSANADLGVLQDASRNFYSSGGVALDATIRGTFGSPQVVGKAGTEECQPELRECTQRTRERKWRHSAEWHERFHPESDR